MSVHLCDIPQKSTLKEFWRAENILHANKEAIEQTGKQARMQAGKQVGKHFDVREHSF